MVKSSKMTGETLSPYLLAIKSLATRIPRIILPRIDDLHPETNSPYLVSGKTVIKLKLEDSDENIASDNNRNIDDNSSSNFIPDKLQDENVGSYPAADNSRAITHKILEEFTYVCYICGVNPGQRKLKAHLCSHTESHALACETCKLEFEDVSAMNKHYKVHPEMLNLVCNICKETFANRFKLETHRQEHKKTTALNKNKYSTSSGEKKFTCSVCGKTCSTKQAVEFHLRIHSDERKFACKICNKTFKYFQYLKTHKLLHSNEKPFSCDTCKKKFRQRTHLRTHVSTVHLGERKYPCMECGEKFTQSSHLKTHMIVHSGDKPYTCDICSKAFSYRAALRDHINSHKDVRNFNCPQCEKSFVQCSARNSHIKRIHVGLNRCVYCDLHFRYKVSLSKHIREQHSSCSKLPQDI